jgi:hypothetical protein
MKMELKDFIAETLSQIVAGVAEAQTKVTSSGGQVSPHVRNPHEDKLGALYGRTNGGNPVIFVDFDVAVTADQGTGTKGGIGVVAGIFNLGSSGQSNENLQIANKIKFKIPVALPLQHESGSKVE